MILVVDDEDLVRNVAQLMIERLGYGVVAAADGEEAVAVFRERAPEFTAVMLDMTMPRMSGVQTLEALREIRPGIPVILVSGYGEQDAVARFEGHRLSGFLQKPFQLPGLREKLEAVTSG